ncbi:MAG: hypothetical protein RR585_14905 [Coprobacillus sp.]
MKSESKSKDSIEFVEQFNKLDTNSKQFLSGYILAKTEERDKQQKRIVRSDRSYDDNK